MVGHQELSRVKSGEGRKLERVVCRLSEVFVPHSQCQRETLSSLPGVLEEVTLAEQIRMVNRIADVDVGRAAGSTEIVNEVRQRRESASVSEPKGTAFIKRRMLLRNL